MKILPNYIIEYMPELEEAIEEVRLSVIDHAYEMLKCLDIDELSSDEIRRKLELYDIKVEDMTDNWLPNGRFYRMYPSIKYNRTRQNALYAIAKSGGQFEGVWSTGFSKTSEYNFRSIQVLRHYEIGSDMDGYFYISGNASRHSDSHVISSALMALQSDILMAQALPAGYTYLYIPWPRPVYPGDSTYFYNVNMLAFDRLTFVEDCNVAATDRDAYSRTYNGKYPASMSYDWQKGSNTPWRTPYWFDYHYVNNMTHTSSSGVSLSWPISESGTYYYYDFDDSKVEIPLDGDGRPIIPTNDKYPEIYIADQTELYDPKSVFPTKCYTHGRYRTSEPNRLQRFLFNKHLTLVSYDEDYEMMVAQVIATVCQITSIDDAIALIRSCPVSIPFDKDRYTIEQAYDFIDSHTTEIVEDSITTTVTSYTASFSNAVDDVFTNLKDTLASIFSLDDQTATNHATSIINGDEVRIQIPDGISTEDVISRISPYCDVDIITIDIPFISTTEREVSYCTLAPLTDSIDENEFIDYTDNLSNEAGPYRADILAKDAYIEHDNLSHINTYKPFWNEKTPFFDMVQQPNDQNEKSSLFNWFSLKQGNNIIAIPFDHQRKVTSVKLESVSDQHRTDVQLALSTLYSIDASEADEMLESLPYILNKKSGDDNYDEVILSLKSAGAELTIYYDEYSEKVESIIRDNEPPISKETFTSYDRPTVGKLDPLYVGYTRDGEDNQGDDKNLSNYLRSATPIYSYGALDNDWYDPIMSYNLILKYSDDKPKYDENSPSIYYEPYAFLEGDPCTDRLYLNLNEIDQAPWRVNHYNYVTFKKTRVHRLWFSKDRRDTLLHEFHNYLYKAKSNNSEATSGITFCDSPISVYRNPLLIDSDGQPTQVIDSLNNNRSFTVTDRSAGWIKISSGNLNGWIHSKYTSLGVDELYKYSENTSSLDYHIIGIYNEAGEQLDYDIARLLLFVNNDSGSPTYELVCDAHKVEIKDQLEMDLNNQWMPVEDNANDNYIVGLLNDSSYSVYKSFSNYHQNSKTAIMTLKVYVVGVLSFNVKIMGCGEIPNSSTAAWDYPYISIKDPNGRVTTKNFSSGTTSENASLESYASWNDFTVSLPSRGQYEISIAYRKDGSRHWGLDRAYFAFKLNELQKTVIQYTRINAAYVDFTVSKSSSISNSDNQIYLPSSLGDGMWDTRFRQLYPKYMPTRDLVYGDEENWWLPRDEYINRGYTFRQTSIDLGDITSNSVNKVSESVFIDLGVIE